MLDRQRRCRFNRMEDCPLLIDQSLTSIRLGKLVPQTPACSAVRLIPRELPNNPQAPAQNSSPPCSILNSTHFCLPLKFHLERRESDLGLKVGRTGRTVSTLSPLLSPLPTHNLELLVKDDTQERAVHQQPAIVIN